jgi:hypothetical protein
MSDYAELEIGLYSRDAKSYTVELHFRDLDRHDGVRPYRGPVHLDLSALR